INWNGPIGKLLAQDWRVGLRGLRPLLGLTATDDEYEAMVEDFVTDSGEQKIFLNVTMVTGRVPPVPAPGPAESAPAATI
ncbi:hypothetical protein HK405_010431, partial [Cladochytrium tenue]